MILPVKRIPEGHSVLSQTVVFNNEQAQDLSITDLVCRAELDRIRSQLHIRLFFSGDVRLECSRCLAPVQYPLQGDFRIMCVHRSYVGKNKGCPEEDIDCVFDDTTDEIDLTPFLYEEIMVSLPMKPLCSEQCMGMDVENRANILKDPERTIAEPAIDPRWAALKKITDKNNCNPDETAFSMRRK